MAELQDDFSNIFATVFLTIWRIKERERYRNIKDSVNVQFESLTTMITYIVILEISLHGYVQLATLVLTASFTLSFRTSATLLSKPIG